MKTNKNIPTVIVGDAHLVNENSAAGAASNLTSFVSPALSPDLQKTQQKLLS